MFVSNKLLNALPPELLARLSSRLHRVSFDSRQVVGLSHLFDGIWFIESGFLSLMLILPDGREAEVGTMGREGLLGHPLFFGGRTIVTEARILVPVTTLRMDVQFFNKIISEEDVFRDVMFKYIESIHEENARSIACIGHHGVEQRLASWLLTATARLESATVPATHEELGSRLCVRRASITCALQTLQRFGAISYTRGRINIVDQSALEARACDCSRRMPTVGSVTAVRSCPAEEPPNSPSALPVRFQGYRIHFLDDRRRVIAVDGFDASSDNEAFETAAFIIDACRDAFSAHELWRGGEIIATDRDAILRGPPGIGELMQKRQQNVCEREEFLRDHFLCMRDSRKLLATLQAFETVLDVA